MKFIKIDDLIIKTEDINSLQIQDIDCITVYFNKPIYMCRKYGFDGRDWRCLDEDDDDSDFCDFLWGMDVTDEKSIKGLLTFTGIGS